MAKSTRSKWRRKMRNVKREKYAKKDDERLQRIIKMAQKNDAETSELFTVKTAEEIKKQQEAKPEEAAGASMDVDAKVKTFDPKTKKDEHGHYPVWMNQRAIKKHKKQVQEKGKKKKLKW